MDNSKNKHNESLGVNKTGKNIRKSPLHQPNYGNNNNNNVNGARQQQQQPQPHVYNISKNEFRDIVQQLTGSPSQDPSSKPPQSNSPKPQSMRLQKIRPPPLPYVRPPLPASYNNTTTTTTTTFTLAPRPVQFPQPNTAESPISAYVRYLEHSLTDPASKGTPLRPSSSLLPNNPIFPSPRFNPMNPLPPHVSGVPSPQTNGPVLPSPTSQFPLPSPNGYMNFLSPQSGYPPLLSPGIQFPSPFTPNFPFSPFGQSGIFGSGQQPPLSPGMFPLSPSGFFPITSPRW